uniref:MAT homeobox alpha 2 protein n=1 Tax=Suhomyces anneliseae TaxID=246025 RepID=A0A3Q9FFJ4_9ASCO|nr:MAT homeobox alpha 2 protein [Suhomyces anneliseae]AZQ56654.1 MAT homeobox alpha 2 protein [Suhomyces anneliseae]
MNSHIESLRLIELHLKMHITTICTFPVFDAEIMNSEIEAHASFIQSYLERIPYLSNEDSELIKSISNLIKVLRLMVRERLDLHSKLFKLSEGTDLGLSVDSSFSISARPNKFSKEQIQKLEEWYESSLEHPYLNSSSTEYLHSSTGLTKMQIKNWVSNKRRKEKSNQVSKELEPFLN